MANAEKKRPRLFLWISLAVLAGLLALAAAFTGDDKPKSSRSDLPIVRHLKWGEGPNITERQFYDGLKTHFENAGQARVSKEGSEYFMRSTEKWCLAIMDGFGAAIPNGVTIWCKNGTETVWRMDRS